MFANRWRIAFIVLIVLVLGSWAAAFFYVRNQSQLFTEAQNDQAKAKADVADCQKNLEQSNSDKTNCLGDLQKLEDQTKLSAGDILEPEAAAKAVVAYANMNLLQDGSKATYESVTEQNGVYALKLKVGGQEYTSYATRDGKILFVSGIPLTDTKVAATAAPSMTKTVKPDVKLFVMSYCPYGLQAEKMYLPVYNLLKDKATMGIYFVNYSMHGKREIDEDLRQYCIQKEQADKYPAYLQCFVDNPSPASDAAADYSACLVSAAVDPAKLGACVAASDTQFNITKDYNDRSTWISGTYPKVEINNDLNAKYSVQGSPTIVINGKESQLSSRSPEQFLKAVCLAFSNPPAECNIKLSDDQPATGFGGGTATATGAAGGCGN